MAVFWVQQWFALPVILEDMVMADEPHISQQSQQPMVHSNDPARISTSRPGSSHYDNSQYGSSQPAGMEFERSLGHGTAFGGRRASPLNLDGLGAALPSFQSHTVPFGQQSFPQPFHQGPQNPAMMYQLQQASHFAGQNATSNPTYNVQFSQQYPNTYQQPHPIQTGVPQGFQQLAPSPQQQSYLGQQFLPQQQQAQHFATGYGQQGQGFQGMPGRQNPYGQQYAARQSLGYAQAQMGQGNDPRAMAGVYAIADPSSGAFPHGQQGGVSYLQPGPNPSISRQSSGSSSQAQPTIPRGPPRKPKQSGHALWVGNLPPGTHVVDLKDHFSRDATTDIESVFLISKSNCAFVNYKSEATCAAAMGRFHDSRFQGVRLVCRLRRGTAPASVGTPTGPSSSQPPPSPEKTRPTTDDEDIKSAEPEAEVGPSSSQQPDDSMPKVKEKFFIVKSLTVEDLELSVRNGIWATQAHNETALNKAYESAENVYLVFSANKSGEYFGYARMVSPIDDKAAATFEFPSRAGPSPTEGDLPNTIPTPATAFAPKGRIIDDSARGTIFWEADLVDLEEKDNSGDDSKSEKSIDAEEGASNQSFGKPFKIEWVSTERLPFYRTRGLRNPWNANREVKIARDGTELEPSVGRRLVQMFHRPMVPQASGGRPTPQTVQMGYPAPRPY